MRQNGVEINCLFSKLLSQPYWQTSFGSKSKRSHFVILLAFLIPLLVWTARFKSFGSKRKKTLSFILWLIPTHWIYLSRCSLHCRQIRVAAEPRWPRAAPEESLHSDRGDGQQDPESRGRELPAVQGGRSEWCVEDLRGVCRSYCGGGIL